MPKNNYATLFSNKTTGFLKGRLGVSSFNNALHHQSFLTPGTKVVGLTKHQLTDNKNITVFSPTMLHSDMRAVIRQKMMERHSGFALFKVKNFIFCSSQNISKEDDKPEANQVFKYKVDFEELEPVKYLESPAPLTKF